MDRTVKQIAEGLQLTELEVRSIISLADLKVRGEGPKPTRGATPKLYRLEDVKRIWDYLKSFEQSPDLTTY